MVTGSDDYTIVLEKFDEGATFLAEKFGCHWDSPKALYRRNHALFLYTTAKQPEKGIFNNIPVVFDNFNFYAALFTAFFREKVSLRSSLK